VNRRKEERGLTEIPRILRGEKKGDFSNRLLTPGGGLVYSEIKKGSSITTVQSSEKLLHPEKDPLVPVKYNENKRLVQRSKIQKRGKSLLRKDRKSSTGRGVCLPLQAVNPAGSKGARRKDAGKKKRPLHGYKRRGGIKLKSTLKRSKETHASGGYARRRASTSEIPPRRQKKISGGNCTRLVLLPSSGKTQR